MFSIWYLIAVKYTPFQKALESLKAEQRRRRQDAVVEDKTLVADREHEKEVEFSLIQDSSGLPVMSLQLSIRRKE